MLLENLQVNLDILYNLTGIILNVMVKKTTPEILRKLFECIKCESCKVVKYIL
jgi:hypothetical protein